MFAAKPKLRELGVHRRYLYCRLFLLGGFKMNGLIYLIGLIVVVLAILSFFGLR